MKIQRVLTRVYISPDDLEQSIAFYEQLFGEKSNLRFKYPEADLELAQISSVLLIAGSEAALAPFRQTIATFGVDSILEARDALLQNGATILDGPKVVPTGQNMHARHPDGTIMEYVELAKR